MNKIYDAVALGELLIDFTENGISPREIPFWKPIQEALPATFWLC